MVLDQDSRDRRGRRGVDLGRLVVTHRALSSAYVRSNSLLETVRVGPSPDPGRPLVIGVAQAFGLTTTVPLIIFMPHLNSYSPASGDGHADTGGRGENTCSQDAREQLHDSFLSIRLTRRSGCHYTGSGGFRSKRFRRSEFISTETLDRDMAALASTGDSVHPVHG